MSEHALEVMEFHRVLERVAQRASSDLGRERVLGLRPRSGPDDIARELGRVATVAAFLERCPDWSLGAVPDVRASLAQVAAEGAILEGGAIYSLGILLTTSRLLKTGLEAQAPGTDALEAIESRLVHLRAIEEDITRCVDADGSVLSTASRELKKVRDRLRGAHARVVRALEGYLASLPDRVVVADGSVSIRDGRYVVPIRREGKGEVGGIVHGESQTGATLFVEPPVAIELMNRLRDLELEEAREVLRVLRGLTESLAPRALEIEGALDALGEWDGLEARARCARSWGAAVPEIAAAGERGLRIRGGRHPLLLEASHGAVIPFDLDLAAEERALVVSGPNTGGKSVFLKASGLIAALAQSGVVPPVDPGTRLPVFSSIFADIGDEQSIARNMSTFSAHLENLSDIVSQAEGTSLVLIDEMGTGTDPAEGAALARAVLEELVARGATAIVTSHLGELKRLDTAGSGIVNASLQFDAERMEPTYRLVKGRPGRSYGLAIARRLGFPGAVLDRAEALREEGEAELEELLARLEREEQEARELSLRLDLERSEAVDVRAELEGRERALREAERTAKERAVEDARRLLLAARSEVEGAIHDLKSAVSSGQDLERASREARRRVEGAARRHLDRRSERASGGQPGAFAPGDAVRISSTGSRGRVVELRDDRAWIEAGALRLEVPVKDLESVAVDDSARPAGRSQGWRGPSGGSARIEVDLRGMRVDEMETELTRALDQALLGDLPELRIIHGKGTGALRRRVAEILERDARLSGHRMGEPNEGGAGVTIAKFRG